MKKSLEEMKADRENRTLLETPEKKTSRGLTSKLRSMERKKEKKNGRVSNGVKIHRCSFMTCFLTSSQRFASLRPSVVLAPKQKQFALKLHRIGGDNETYITQAIKPMGEATFTRNLYPGPACYIKVQDEVIYSLLRRYR